MLCVKAKIVKEDGTNLDDAADEVIPINLFSLFSQVDVYFQQKLVSSSSTNYPYKAMMDVLLNFGQDATSTQLQTQLYYADTPGSMDHTDPTTTPINAGLIKRNNTAKGSALVDMVGPMYADVFQLSRFLLNEVEVRLKLSVQKCISSDDWGEDNKIQSDHHRCPVESSYGRRIRTLRCREERYPCTPLCDGIRQFW